MSIVTIERWWKEIVRVVDSIERNVGRCCEYGEMWREVYRAVVGNGLRVFRKLLRVAKKFKDTDDAKLFIDSLVRLVGGMEVGLRAKSCEEAVRAIDFDLLKRFRDINFYLRVFSAENTIKIKYGVKNVGEGLQC